MYVSIYWRDSCVSVGFIALFGIALANGMVLVTYLNQLLHDGVTVDDVKAKTGCALKVSPALG